MEENALNSTLRSNRSIPGRATVSATWEFMHDTFRTGLISLADWMGLGLQDMSVGLYCNNVPDYSNLYLRKGRKHPSRVEYRK